MPKLPSLEKWPNFLWNPRTQPNPFLFIESRDSRGAVPLFCGAKQYRLLWDAKVLLPGETIVRINMVYKPHEHYFARDRSSVEGIVQGVYPGLAGVHRVSNFFKSDRLWFELSSMSINLEEYLRVLEQENASKGQAP